MLPAAGAGAGRRSDQHHLPSARSRGKCVSHSLFRRGLSGLGYVRPRRRAAPVVPGNRDGPGRRRILHSGIPNQRRREFPAYAARAPLIFRNRVRPGRAEARLMWTAVSTWCMNAVGYRLAGDGATQPVRRRPKPVRTGFEGYRLAGAARVKTMGGAADC